MPGSFFAHDRGVDSLAGRLLVATPKLVDPNFHRTVVFLLANSEGGSMGVVINRPADGATLSRHLPQWADLGADPAVIFVGGPVEPTSGLALGRLPEGAAPGPGLTPVADGLALVDLNRVPADLETVPAAMRVFTGHAGWGGGQLEGEIAERAWFVVEAQPADVLAPDPEDLWRQVLRRQRGDLAMYAYYPAEASLN
jgi:putative transcriptional regulator